MTQDKVIIRRLEDALSTKILKDQIYRLRRFVAGDEASIGGSKVSLK